VIAFCAFCVNNSDVFQLIFKAETTRSKKDYSKLVDRNTDFFYENELIQIANLHPLVFTGTSQETKLLIDK